MSSIILNPERVGRPTSSEAYRLVGMGKRDMTAEELAARPKSGKGSSTKFVEDPNTPDDKFYTYVEEKRIERRMNRSISVDTHTRPMSWGDLMEVMVHQRNDISYKYTSKKTTIHPTIEGWAGSNDFKTEDSVVEVKGYQPLKFAKYYECLEKQSVDALREDFPQEYWQMVSGAAIHVVKYAEAVLYMPYRSDLPKVYHTAMNLDTQDDPWAFKYICDCIEQERHAELAYLPDDSGYKDEIRFRFEVPQSDIDFLTSRVKLAIEKISAKQTE